MTGMSRSTIHHHFRSLTAMSPLQFQKQLRLHAARQKMLTGELDAASAAFEVGYESPSQFNRERSRLLGSNGCGITGLVHRGDGSRKAVGILSSLPTGETVVSVYGLFHETVTTGATAIKTATKQFWPLAEERPNPYKFFVVIGAGRGGRTPTRLPSADFESAASASSAIPALPSASHEFGPIAASSDF